MNAVLDMVRSEEERWEKLGEIRKKEAAAGETPDPYGLGHAALLLPLYCNEHSAYYRKPELLPIMREALDHFLSLQLPSGCISLVNCNIDSPPDTAFTVHLVSLLYQLAERYAFPELEPVRDRLGLFLERAKPCLLTGGVHTPNHRWVMCGALAKMYEIFGDEAFKERAFQYLDEGFDITEYGEWTERSNAIYNAACALHLYDVAVQFDYEPAMDAIRQNLRMMQYMLHPAHTIATEYSGRQDLGQSMVMNDWYYVIYHLMANQDQDPGFAAMARIAEETSPKGSGALIHWMLYPERMKLPETAEPLPETYTILFGENHEVPVPRHVPYLGPLVKHPHGASVLRHRRGKLSVTAMAGQPEILYVQYGKAKMVGLKVTAGWFGIGSVAFPSIKRTGEYTYRLHIELEGCYWQPLPKGLTEGLNGSYVRMPNHLREKTHISYLPVTVDLAMLDDGVELVLTSETMPNIYLQTVCMFDRSGQLAGEGLKEVQPPFVQLVRGEAVYRCGDDCIEVSSGAREHKDVSMRNDKINPDFIHLTMNLVTPTRKRIRIRCFDA